MEKPKLLIVAGPNGSGKTSVTHKILKHEWIEGCEYINPDDIARDISFPLWTDYMFMITLLMMFFPNYYFAQAMAR